MKISDFILYTLATFLGGLLALGVWSLIVKQQATAALAEAKANSPLAKLGLF